MPATKKRPPLELEPGEGKAHEMAESTNEELREGAEPDDAPRARSRKRSAKGAKRTKAPMDGEACCAACAAGKPCSGKAKKDGGCGKRMADGDCPMGKADCEGCPMKKSATDCATCSKRGDSLTPQEYLAACELGIQDRSKVYIRARLDAMAGGPGKSIKCGASHIPAGKKCTKGVAAQAPQREQFGYKQSHYGVKAEAFGRVNGKVLSNKQVRQVERGIVSKELRTGKKEKLTKAQAAALISTRGTASRRHIAAQLTGIKSSALKSSIAATRNTADPMSFAISRVAKRELFNRRVRTAARVVGAGAALGAVTAGALQTRRRDSTWASGFSPELDQLSV